MSWFILLLAVAAFLFWVSRKPDDFRIDRHVQINAPASQVYGWINNVRRFNDWNPWASMDPTSVITYNGTDEGPGASYSWIGKKTGQGSMTLARQSPPKEVEFDLNFIKPWKANNKAVFTLSESGGGTTVTWAMTGKNNFGNKLFQTFMSMDKMVGKDFERGLGSLKEKVEAKRIG